MKKIFLCISIVVPLMFGFASCSGDLHNFGGYYLVGSMNGWDASNPNLIEDNSVTFVASGSSDEFQFLPNKGTWNGQINSNGMKKGTLPSGVELELPADKNGKLTGLTAGQTYIMDVASVDGLIEVSIRQ